MRWKSEQYPCSSGYSNSELSNVNSVCVKKCLGGKAERKCSRRVETKDLKPSTQWMPFVCYTNRRPEIKRPVVVCWMLFKFCLDVLEKYAASIVTLRSRSIFTSLVLAVHRKFWHILSCYSEKKNANGMNTSRLFHYFRFVRCVMQQSAKLWNGYGRDYYWNLTRAWTSHENHICTILDFIFC